MLQAFDFNSIDYILKPVSEEKFAQAIQKFRQRLTKRVTLENLVPILQGAKSPATTYKRRFLVMQGNKLLSMKQEQVTFFTAMSMC